MKKKRKMTPPERFVQKLSKIKGATPYSNSGVYNSFFCVFVRMFTGDRYKILDFHRFDPETFMSHSINYIKDKENSQMHSESVNDFIATCRSFCLYVSKDKRAADIMTEKGFYDAFNSYEDRYGLSDKSKVGLMLYKMYAVLCKSHFYNFNTAEVKDFMFKGGFYRHPFYTSYLEDNDRRNKRFKSLD